MHLAVIGRRIEVVADLERVRAFCDGQLVTDHERLTRALKAPTLRDSVGRLNQGKR